jgi:hypothetical protein
MSKKQRKQGKEEHPWQLIRDSLDAFQPQRLVTQLREFLAPRIPRGAKRIEENTRKALFKEVDALIAANVGPWYRVAGVHLGNESIGGYCQCHSFFNQGNPPDTDLERNLVKILQALRRSHEWLRSLDALFRSVVLPEDEQGRQAAISQALGKTIELTVEATGCEEAWYNFAYSAVDWLLEALGFRITDNVRRAVGKALVDFTSWSGPSAEETRQISDALALELVKKGFGQRYPQS